MVADLKDFSKFHYCCVVNAVEVQTDLKSTALCYLKTIITHCDELRNSSKSLPFDIPIEQTLVEGKILTWFNMANYSAVM